MTYIHASRALEADGEPSVNALMARMAREAGDAQAAAIERALLEGGSRIEIRTLLGHREVYTLPSWRRHPIHRARIMLARLRYRLRRAL